KDRLKPGDSLEIKTPDAVARIRGTTVVAEIVGDSTSTASRFTVMSGTAEVIPVATTAQTPAAITLEARQTVVVRKGTPAGPAETATANNAGPLVASILARSAPPPPRNLPAPPADWSLLIDRGSGFDLWFGVTADGGTAGDRPLDHASLATCDAAARTLAQSGARVA